MHEPPAGREARLSMKNAYAPGNRWWTGERLFALIWVVLALVALAIVITYSRYPPEEFYHFSQEGTAGGLGRALVFSNYPVALISIAMIATSLLALRSTPSVDASRRRIVSGIAIVATLLCLVTAAPGVVDAGDLDAKPINIVPFIGVLLAIALSALAIRRGQWPEEQGWGWRETFSITVVIMLTLVALPWIVADLGYYIDELPLIGRLFIASEVPSGETLAAVHIGHHHGFDGLLFAASALTLSHLTRNRYDGKIAAALPVFLALMFTYGLFNLANDAWLEQVVKRGWVEWEIPSVLNPSVSVAWGLIIVGSVVVWFVLFRSGEPDAEPMVAQRARSLNLKAE
jgi:hypothetical protein